MTHTDEVKNGVTWTNVRVYKTPRGATHVNPKEVKTDWILVSDLDLIIENGVATRAIRHNFSPYRVTCENLFEVPRTSKLVKAGGKYNAAQCMRMIRKGLMVVL